MLCEHMHAFIRLIRMRSCENSDFMHSRASCEALGATDDSFVRLRMLGYSPDALKGAISLHSGALSEALGAAQELLQRTFIICAHTHASVFA